MADGTEPIINTSDDGESRRSWIMSQVRSTNTKPELFVRTSIHRAGFRYRLHVKGLPGSPDLVFPRYRTVVFVNGCFWHWHGCKRSRMPTKNRDYWSSKIERNVRRDQANCAALVEDGWSVLKVWECDLVAGVQRIIEELEFQKTVLAS